MEKDTVYTQKIKQCKVSIQTFNDSFKNQKTKRKRKFISMGILIFLFLLELIWFFLMASGKYGIQITVVRLWLPIILLFIITAIVMFTMDDSKKQKSVLHIQWLRKKIMSVLYPDFQYMYENKENVRNGLLQFYKENVDSGANKIHYFGCLLNEKIDMYELAIYTKENKPSFYGVCVFMQDKNIKNKSVLDHAMEMMEKNYYALKNVEEGFHVIYKDNNYWLFFSEISFDNFMDNETYGNSDIPTVRPMNEEELEANYKFLLSVQAAMDCAMA